MLLMVSCIFCPLITGFTLLPEILSYFDVIRYSNTKYMLKCSQIQNYCGLHGLSDGVVFGIKAVLMEVVGPLAKHI